MNWRGTSRSAIGLDVGARVVKAVQLSGSAGAWRVSAAAMIPRESESPMQAAEIRRLRDVLERQGFTGRRVVVGAPEKQVVTAMLELPPKSSGAPVEQIARAELATMHKLDPQTVEMSHWELPATGRQREGTRLMAVAMKHTDADAMLAAFEAGGLDVAVIDVHAAALARACDVPGAAPEQITAVLDIGWHSAALAILHRGAIVYERRLGDAAIKPLFDHLIKGFEFEPDVVEYLLSDVGLSGVGGENPIVSEQVDDVRTTITEHFTEMVSELAVSFSYAGHQYPEATLTDLLLVGGGGAIPGLAAHLAEQTRLKATAVSPSLRAEVPPALSEICRTSLLTAAMGLAMHPEARA